MRHTRAGAVRPTEKAPATFWRRSARGRSRCRLTPGVRRSSCRTGIDQRTDNSFASAVAGACPRLRPRSRSPATGTSTSAFGGGTVSATRRAATCARSRRPRSFHAPTSARAPPSYTSAARALANASRRPAHSAQRRTGHGPGAPQRSQHGGRQRTSRSRHRAQTASPTRPQTPQRRGRNTSMTCMRQTLRAHLCRECAVFVPSLCQSDCGPARHASLRQEPRAPRKEGARPASPLQIRWHQPSRGDAARICRRSGRTAARSAGSLTGMNRPRGPWRGTTRNVVGTKAASSW